MLKKKKQIVDLERELLYYIWIDTRLDSFTQLGKRILPNKKIDVNPIYKVIDLYVT